MNPLLLGALIQNIALPELARWLQSLHAAGTPLTDELVQAKLLSDANVGIMLGEAWLANHPAS